MTKKSKQMATQTVTTETDILSNSSQGYTDIPRDVYFRDVDWLLKLPDHPDQRNTEAHFRTAIKRHLSKPFVTHDEVSVARYKGKLYVVDAHTRKKGWKEGLLPKPSRLLVKEYDCGNNLAAFKQVYAAHDNINAAETTRDRAYGTLRSLGVANLSKALENCLANTSRILFKLEEAAYTDASRPQRDVQRDLYLANMEHWLSEIRCWNDKALGNERKQVHTALLVSELMTIAEYGMKKSDSFWDRFYANDGIRLGGASDAVDMFIRSMERRKAAKQNAGSDNTVAMINVALQTFEGHLQGKEYRKVWTKARDNRVAIKHMATILKKRVN